MSLKNLKADAGLVVVMLAVIGGGFYMTTKAMNQKSDELATKLASLEMSMKQFCTHDATAPDAAKPDAKPADAKPSGGGAPKADAPTAP